MLTRSRKQGTPYLVPVWVRDVCSTSNALCQRINSDTIIVDVIKDIIQSKLFKSSRWEDLQPHEVVVRHKMKIIAHDETINGIDGNHDASMIKHLIQVENYMSFVEVIESYKQPLEL